MAKKPTTAPGRITYIGAQPHFPVHGESWQENGSGPVKYWHGTAWYLEPPAGEYGTAESAAQSMRLASEETAGDPPADEPEPKPTEEPAGDPEPEAEPEPAKQDPDVNDEVDDLEIEDDLEEVAEDPVEDEVAEPEVAEVDEDPDDEQVPLSIERLETIAATFDPAPRTLVQDCRDIMLDLFKSRPKPWSAMSEESQRDTAAALENGMRDIVRKIVETVRSDEGTQPIRALLEGYSEKDGIKATLKVRSFSPEEELAAVVGLHKARGKFVLVTVASVDDYNGSRDAQTDADQPDLDFEAGDPDGDEPEGDD